MSQTSEKIAQFWQKLRTRSTDQQILDALAPWILACAVGAKNGSIYGAVGSHGILDFELWLDMVRTEDWEARTHAPVKRVKAALRRYVEEHQAEDMNTVLRREEQQRGQPPSIMIGPGEWVEIKFEAEE